jgi:hypothetical protein
MRIAVVVAVGVLATVPAYADRTMSAWIGVTLDERASAATFAAAGDANNTSLNGGMRLTLSFDDAPPVVPAPGAVTFEGRLAPELLGGFLADDTRAEGYIGAGVRIEGWMASHRHDDAMRTAIYLAVRAIAIGEHQDGAGELAFGEYLLTGRRGVFGWEGAAMFRARHDVAPSEAREVDALLNIFVGWR